MSASGSFPRSSFVPADSARGNASARSAAMLPLYVDLDGTLTYTDLLHESVLLLIKRNPFYLFLCLAWLVRGRAYLKAQIAQRIHLDVPLLPYNDAMLAYLQHQHVAGRRLVLASAADRGLVQRVADYLGIFDAVLGSDASLNLKSDAKLRAIEQDAGATGFAYAGNAAADLAVWARAVEVIIVNASPRVVDRLRKLKTPSFIIPLRPFSLRPLMKALRPHQWLKNTLLFVPLLAAHELSVERWLVTLLAFVAFGMCASATYIVNDLFDLASDRAHPRKRTRPFAAATLTISFGIALAAVLLPLALWLAASISLSFFGLMALYVAMTLLYSARLKQIAIVDVLVLASLYTQRILAGGEAGEVVISNWLLTISFFMFLSLALVKRCAELEFISGDGHLSLAGRGYRISDLSYLISMGIASGFVGILLLALYVESQIGGARYPHAEILWLMLPVVLFWIMRLWLKISRMEIRDDPLLFAMGDRTSWVATIVIGCIVVAASMG